MSDTRLARRGPRFIAACIGIGLGAGLLSGLFGVGGGTVIVPMLVLLLGFDQKLASGTSLAAIVPTATVGVVSYAIHGDVEWIVALILAAGAVVGAQIGSWLLAKLPQNAIRWGFVAFLVVVIVMLFLVVPSRDADFEFNVLAVIGLVVVGLFTGTMAGLIGVGGGVIVVPVMMFVFGMSDLAAKGTSLLMMIPTAVSGTVGNFRRGNVDLRAAALVGLAACTTTALGAWLASLMEPQLANILFAVFLVFIATQMALKAIRARPSR